MEKEKLKTNFDVFEKAMLEVKNIKKMDQKIESLKAVLKVSIHEVSTDLKNEESIKDYIKEIYENDDISCEDRDKKFKELVFKNVKNEKFKSYYAEKEKIKVVISNNLESLNKLSDEFLKLLNNLLIYRRIKEYILATKCPLVYDNRYNYIDEYPLISEEEAVQRKKDENNQKDNLVEILRNAYMDSFQDFEKMDNLLSKSSSNKFNDSDFYYCLLDLLDLAKEYDIPNLNYKNLENMIAVVDLLDSEILVKNGACSRDIFDFHKNLLMLMEDYCNQNNKFGYFSLNEIKKRYKKSFYDLIEHSKTENKYVDIYKIENKYIDIYKIFGSKSAVEIGMRKIMDEDQVIEHWREYLKLSLPVDERFKLYKDIAKVLISFDKEKKLQFKNDKELLELIGSPILQNNYDVKQYRIEDIWLEVVWRKWMIEYEPKDFSVILRKGDEIYVNKIKEFAHVLIKEINEKINMSISYDGKCLFLEDERLSNKERQDIVNTFVRIFTKIEAEDMQIAIDFFNKNEQDDEVFIFDWDNELESELNDLIALELRVNLNKKVKKNKPKKF